MNPGEAPRAPSKRLAYIDCLRGIAIILVVAVHTGQQMSSAPFFARWSQYGQYGVQLFFVVSGFSLCLAATGGEVRGYGAFLLRRVCRIAPMYYIALLLFFLITLYIERVNHGVAFFTPIAEYTAPRVTANLLLVHGLVPSANNSIVPGGWSIGCEFLFYAAFPWLLIIRRTALLLAVVVAAGIGSFGLQYIPGLAPWSFYYSMPVQLPCFVAGMLVYRFSENKTFNAIATFAATGAFFLLFKAHHVSWGWRLSPLLAAVAFGGLTSLMHAWRPRGIWFLLVTGRASFSIYCLHYAFVRLVAPPLAQQWVTNGKLPELAAWGAFAVTLLLSTVVATATYRWIEVPFIRLGRRITE